MPYLHKNDVQSVGATACHNIMLHQFDTCRRSSQGPRNLLLWLAFVITVAAIMPWHTLGLWRVHISARHCPGIHDSDDTRIYGVVGSLKKYRLIPNFLLSLTVTELWKSFNIWRSYWQEFGVLFFWLTVYCTLYRPSCRNSACRNRNCRNSACRNRNRLP